MAEATYRIMSPPRERNERRTFSTAFQRGGAKSRRTMMATPSPIARSKAIGVCQMVITGAREGVDESPFSPIENPKIFDGEEWLQYSS